MDSNFLDSKEQFTNRVLNQHRSSSSYGHRRSMDECVVFQTRCVSVSKTPVNTTAPINPGHGDQNQNQTSFWPGSEVSSGNPGHKDFQPPHFYAQSPCQQRQSGNWGPNQQLDAAVTQDDLRKKLIQVAAERDQLRQDLRNYSAENANLRQQLLCRRRIQSNEAYHNNNTYPEEPVQLEGNNRPSSHLTPVNCCVQLKGTSDDEDESNDSSDDDISFLLPQDLTGEANQSRISVMLSQSMTVLANINNQEMMEKVCAGSQIAKQLLVGNFAGYFASYMVRRFGKIAAGSLLGSLCVLKLAHHRGYIAVDWNRIQKQMDGTAAASAGKVDDAGLSVEDDIAWVTDKIQEVRRWSQENTYTVLGFCTGFFFYNFHR